jgi:hypothetical protein
VAPTEMTGAALAEGSGRSEAGGPPRTTGWRGVPVELGFVMLALVVNGVVRSHTRDDHAEAVAHAADVLALEERLHLDWEHALQDLTLAVPGLAELSAWYYVAGYLPIVIGTMGWLYARHRDSYRLLRNALLASGAIGMLGYAFYPTAPPRLTEFGFNDPVAAEALGDAARPAGIANEIAAIPSFHVAWLALAVVVATTVVRARWLRALLLLQPVIMSFVVIGTANHWVLDIPPGLAVAAFGLYVAHRIDARPAAAATSAASTPQQCRHLGQVEELGDGDR